MEAQTNSRCPSGRLFYVSIQQLTGLTVKAGEAPLEANQITDVTALKELTQLKILHLESNPDLTKAQIAELQKALPKCDIRSNPTK